MKHILLSAFLVAALAFSACEQQGGVNDPVSPGASSEALLRAVNNLDLSTEQIAQLDEMFWLDEDLSLLLDPVRTDAFYSVLDGTAPFFNGPRDRGGMGFDMGGMLHLSMILKANPNLSDEKKAELLSLIQASNAKRLEIIEQNKDNPELMRQLLKEEHDKLIAAMNALLSPEELQALEDLIAEIKQLREDRRDQWNQMRIDFQVQKMKEGLGLTEEQAAQIKKILQDQYEAIKALREQYAGDPEGLREALKTLLGETDAKIREVLDDDQEEKWDEWKQGRKDKRDKRDWRDWRRGGGKGGSGIGPRG